MSYGGCSLAECVICGATCALAGFGASYCEKCDPDAEQPSYDEVCALAVELARTLTHLRGQLEQRIWPDQTKLNALVLRRDVSRLVQG